MWLTPTWIANVTGLTRWAGAIFLGMDSAVSFLAGIVGLPILGSFVLWLLYGAMAARMEKMLAWILPLAGCIALQFTVVRGVVVRQNSIGITYCRHAPPSFEFAAPSIFESLTPRGNVKPKAGGRVDAL